MSAIMRLQMVWAEMATYKENHTGAALIGTRCRRDDTIHVKLRSGHTRAQRHVAGLEQVYPQCPNCNVTQATPTYILALLVVIRASCSQVLVHKGCDIQFCWIPSHVGITGNEQADIVARSATTELPLTVPLCDMKRVIQHRIDNAWQESWNLQTNNKLHCVKPVIGALPVMPMRRTDVKLTRLRIGPTRFTHRHLLLDENAPECPPSTRGLLATNFITLNHGQVTRTVPEIPPPNFHTTPTRGRLSLDRLYVHRLPTRRVFSGTRLELMTPLPRVRYLDH
ncbi:RNase H domain-containing protein [Trichonephila clavipes]|nr:RNase H domain-containing protein [Trichonephila clavipes]